jgi:hypothetical protein
MTKTFDLTAKEFKAARAFVASCLKGMGGDRPADLADDEYTWIDLGDLLKVGFTRHEAAGLMSSLDAKGFISEYEKNQWIVETAGWQWMDTRWDESAA